MARSLFQLGMKLSNTLFILALFKHVHDKHALCLSGLEDDYGFKYVHAQTLDAFQVSEGIILYLSGFFFVCVAQNIYRPPSFSSLSIITEGCFDWPNPSHFSRGWCTVNHEGLDPKERPDYVTSAQQAAPLIPSCSLVTLPSVPSLTCHTFPLCHVTLRFQWHI